MRLLIIGSRIPWPLRDGGAIATYNMLRGLSRKGIEIDFISLNTSKHFVSPQDIQNNFGFLRSVKTHSIDTSVTAVAAFRNLFSRRSYNIERFTDRTFVSSIQEALDGNSYDVIHFEGLFVAQYAEMVKTGVPKLLRQHNIEYRIWKTLSLTDSSLLKRPYLRLLAGRLERFERRNISLFDAVVSITDDDLRITAGELGYRGLTASIPAGIETPDEINMNPVPDHLYHIGSMEWMPNREAMKWFHDRIWPLIHAELPEAVFFMAGKQMPQEYRDWNCPHFRVEGEVSDPDAFSWDKAILAVPLRSGSGIRIKTIEAMMKGKAVVSTTTGAAGLPVTDGTHLLLADNEDAFAEAVVRLIRNPGLRETLARNGKKLAEEMYGNDSVAEKWVAFYQRICGRNK